MGWMTTYAAVVRISGLFRPFNRRLKKWKGGRKMKEDKFLELDFKDMPSGFKINRREFIKITGGGIFIFFMLGAIRR